MKTLMRYQLFTLLLLALWACQAQAGLGDLYAAEVAVEDDSPEVRNQALGQAMQKVLVRLSGSTDVAGHPQAAKVLGRAPSLVQQFRYRLDDPQPSVDGQESQPPQRYLWAKFDKLATDRLLRESNIPVWGNQRPRVLVWLAVERAGKRSLLNLESDPLAREALQQRAFARGMPMQLPLMDLQDQAALSAADLWSGYEAAIREASSRYPHDVILSGRLRSSGGNSWSADWSLWEADSQEGFSRHGLAWQDALGSGIDGAQDLLAAHYAPAVGGDGPERLRVRFTGVDTLQAYGRLMQIIGNKEVISQVNLRAANDQGLFADLWVRGGRSALTRTLSLGGELFLQTADEQLLPPPGQAPQPQRPAPPVDLTFSFLAPVAADSGAQ